MVKNNKVEVFKNGCGKWQARIRWNNGEKYMHSEAYTKKHGAIKSAKKFFKLLTGNCLFEVIE